ncbi:MAG: addiction module protein [Verrucomicrobiota bacterium]
MSPLLEKISKEVMNLPQEEKISLVNLLLEDLDGIEDSEEEIQQAWDEEIQRRVDLVKSDKAQLFDGEEVLKEARDIIKK